MADLKIIGLDVVDYKRIRAVELRLDEAGTLVTVGGENGQGKSSLIDAIEAALCGPDRRTTEPVRKGARVASVRVDLGEFAVVREFDAKGTTSLRITDPSGMAPPRPKEFLDRVLGGMFVDPVRFAEAAPRDRRNMVMSLAGVDVASLDANVKKAREDVKEREREQDHARARAENLTEHPDAPKDFVDVTALTSQIQAAVESNAANDRARRDVADATRWVEELEAKLADAKKRLAELPRPGEDTDVEPLRQRIAEAEDTNAKVRANRALAEARDEWRQAERARAAAEAALEEALAARTVAFQSAALPTPELGVDDDDVTIAGVPVAQASQAERLRVGLAVALAQAGRVAPVLVRDGSLLDRKTLAAMTEACEAVGAQLFVERVVDSGSAAEDECTVVIVDGRIKGDGGPASLFGDQE